MSIDLGVLGAKVNLVTAGFERGVRTVKSGFSTMGAGAIVLNQTLSLVGKGFQIMETTIKKSLGVFIEAADTAERYRVTLDILLGSAEEGGRMFDEMSKFAAKVPFEYEKIMSSATALAGVMNGGVDEVKQWMPMIADLAAVSRLSIEDTTGQIIRMYSAGASAADLFRERGITAMLGFSAGVTYTADQTRKKLQEAFESPVSKFRGAANDLANTWTGLISMVSDRWFIFRNKVMSGGAFSEIKNVVKDILSELDKLDADGTLNRWAKNIGDTIITATKTLVKFAKNDLPGYIEAVKVKLDYIWSIIKYDPAIIEWGLVGLAISGKKGAVLFASLGHMKQWLDNISKALGLVSAGVLNMSDVASANFKELEALVNGFDASPVLAQMKTKASELKSEIADIQKRTENGFFHFSGDFERLDAAKSELKRIEQLIKVQETALKAANGEYNQYVDKTRLSGGGVGPSTGTSTHATPSSVDDSSIQKTINAMKSLKSTYDDMQHELSKTGKTEIEQALSDAQYQAEKLRIEYADIIGQSPKISSMIDQIEKLAIANAKASEAFKVSQKISDATVSLKSIQSEAMYALQDQNLSSYEQSVVEISRSVADLRDRYSDLIQKSPELGEMIDQIERLKNAQLEVEQAAQVQSLVDQQKAQYESLFTSDNSFSQELEEINRQYDEMISKSGQIAQFADQWKANAVAIAEYKKTADGIKSVTDGLVTHFADAFAEFAKTGKMNLKDLGKALVEELQMMAAQKTAQLLMNAAFAGAMYIYSLASYNSDAAAKWAAAATESLAGAAIMGSYVAGSGLAGMAHDGISSIPEDGTWLLQKNERVVDSDTNADLKAFLKEGSKGATVNQVVNINGGDEKSILNALPAMKQAAIDAVNESIASRGDIYKTIQVMNPS